MPPFVADFGDAATEAAALIEALGPIADRLGTRGTVAQYEADVGDPNLTRAGTSLAGSSGPLPRFLPVRDIIRISFNLIEVRPPQTILKRLARSPRIPTDDNLMLTLPLAPTLRDALELSIRYGNAALPWWRRELVTVGEEAHIRYWPAGPMGRLEPISAELTLISTHRTVETIMGLKTAAARINFAVPPVSDPADLAAQLGCDVTVGGEAHFMAFPLAALSWPSPYRDEALWQDGLARCEADLRQLRDVPLIARVRGHVGSRIDRGQLVGLDDSAIALGMSVRSLVRALAEAGTSHHQMVEQERRSRAHQLLAGSSRPLADIAEQLGFSDQSSFGRKCREWFGDSPARIRQRLTGQ
ncbi:helix-turn-helix transcriptional regulator [Sandarakinorhabdus oryzae]|uniref:helix-turn-helix transcriptional regulator n=1 Tax=Sandarakinorhabdus oryzae TaxID=2675220 RepID=UPI0012E0D4D3|nr:AraC family transcriptional regulator [Sandarakinorhabdus oryzae]